MLRRSLDTETTGLDVYHSARPFFVTMCDPEGELLYWETDVDPETREPQWTLGDWGEIRTAIEETDELILQNPKFDAQALFQLDRSFQTVWDWTKVRDTLLAGHLLSSNRPHDLTSMTLQFLRIDMSEPEERLKEIVKECRRLARSDFPSWKIAKAGYEDMPSAKDETWKHDMWLPRALAKELKLCRGVCEVVNKRNEQFDIYIGRGSDWGNPFKIGEDGTRAEVIEKYRHWLQNQPELLTRLPELDGKRLGCFCSPLACHGDVLQELLAKHTHPWWTACRDYANTDSSATLPLYDAQKKLIEERGLWPIYQERLKLLPIVCGMEERGITLSSERLEQQQKDYLEEADKAGAVCTTIAASHGYDLELPKSGNNQSLLRYVFGPLGLPMLKTSKKTGNPSMDKDVIAEWLITLPERSKQASFIRNLSAKRKRDTALSYMAGYRRFWLPTGKKGWYVLHPSLNPTGTDTLRWSSQSPNEQNISKKEGFNLRHSFGPAPGREWWSLDYQNIELRIPAYESGEEAMVELFDKPNDPPYFGSYHLLNASIVYPDLFWPLAETEGAFKDKYKSTWYQRCKNGGFAIQYGCQEAKADATFGRSGAFRSIKEKMPKVAALNDKYVRQANRQGYVETLPDKSIGMSKGYPIYCSRTSWGDISPTIPLNYHVQSTACWAIMKAMIRVTEYLQQFDGYYLIMQIHDELVLDFPAYGKRNLPKIRKVQKLMEESGVDIGIPLTTSIAYHPTSWDEEIEI